MAQNPSDERESTPGAGHPSLAAKSSRVGARGGGAGPSEGSSSIPRSAVPPLLVEAEQFLIGDLDVAAVRGALAGLGASGSTAFDALSASETIALLAHLQAMTGAVAALQARSLVHLEQAITEDCRQREETPQQARKIARAEVSKALKQSKSCAGQSMSSGRRLVQSMPGMVEALAQGQITPASAHRVARTMAPATPEQREEVDAVLTAHLPYLEDCGTEEWGGEAERVLHAVDPHGASDRHQSVKQDRSVTVRRSEHGMCTVTARLPGLDGARIRKGLSLAAEKARAHGDRRGHQQIMADLFADALIGRGDGVDPSTLEIAVIITDRSLLAPDHADVATIEGYGPVPYQHIREEMRAAIDSASDDPELALTLRRLYLDAEDGQLVAAESASREFPPAMSRFLRLAHETCRAPHCDASIRQNDHIVPHAQGGPTSLANGNGLCAADNQKEEAGESARVLTDEDGNRRTVEWTSRYGQKAQRRGINFDPLGTAYRQRERDHEREHERERMAAREAHRDRERREKREQFQAQTRDRHERAQQNLRTLERLCAESSPEYTGASLHRAFAQLDPGRFDHMDLHPAARWSDTESRCRRRRRIDYIPRPYSLGVGRGGGAAGDSAD